MDANLSYEAKVADMRVGERIAVRTRRNITQEVPFDDRGHPVSVMDFHLRGLITGNTGDGQSVQVDWEDPRSVPPRFYLYKSQDTVWPMALGQTPGWDPMIGFAFLDQPQDVDLFRIAPFWCQRFGDH